MDSMNSTRSFHSNSQASHQTNSQNATQTNARRQKVKSVEPTRWDKRTTEIFITLCAEEVRAGNRPGAHLNKIGFENLIRKFSISAGRKYDRQQLKNRWDALRKEWRDWKTLMHGETGIGYNHDLGIIDADPEWWSRKIQQNPPVAKFRERGPYSPFEQELLFSDIVATWGIHGLQALV